MTTILSQVTCSMGNMKIDELKWKEHLVSTNYLHLCENTKDKIAKKNFRNDF